MSEILGLVPGAGWLKLFFGPVGKWLLIGTVIVLALAEADHRGYARAAGKCQTASLEAKITALTVDKQTSDATAQRFAADAARSAEIAAQNIAILEEYRRAPRSAACILTADDARRLRGIR